MKLKRLISVFLCLVILALTVPGVIASEDSTNSFDKNKTELLTYLKIVDKPSDVGLYGEKVTRADFAVYVGKIVGISEKNKCDKRFFVDLPEDHWGYNTINTMTE